MDSFTSARTKTVQTTDRTEGVDGRWLALQRAVAIGMIVVLAAPMVLIARTFIPPLAIAGTLFAVALVLTWVRPRASAITIGLFASLWLLFQLLNLPQVVPDLTRPSATLFFLITVAMLVFGIAGLVGLVGVLRRLSGRIAVRTLQAVGAVMIGSVVFSLLAGL